MFHNSKEDLCIYRCLREMTSRDPTAPVGTQRPSAGNHVVAQSSPHLHCSARFAAGSAKFVGMENSSNSLACSIWYRSVHVIIGYTNQGGDVSPGYTTCAVHTVVHFRWGRCCKARATLFPATSLLFSGDSGKNVSYLLPAVPSEKRDLSLKDTQFVRSL